MKKKVDEKIINYDTQKDKVEAIVSKHTSIEKELSSGNDSKKYAEKSEEYAELGYY